MEELNTELWKLGILAKTEHNEVAPAQHELAPHLHHHQSSPRTRTSSPWRSCSGWRPSHGHGVPAPRKPFAGVNGSGKHNNWSLSTDTGVNLSPGDTPPRKRPVPAVPLAAVIQAVDDYQDLLRMSPPPATTTGWGQRGAPRRDLRCSWG